MDWYYAEAGKQLGPVSQAEFDALVQRGTIGISTLVWNETMTQWQPLSVVRASSQPPSLPGVATSVCSQCQRTFAADDVLILLGVAVCASCKPGFLQRMKEGVTPMSSDGLYKSGTDVIAPLSAEFPDRCIHCGAVGDGQRITKKVYWHPSWIYVLVILSIWIYVIVALIVRKKALVTFTVCPEHRTNHWLWVAISWVSFIAFIGSIVAIVSLNFLAIVGVLVSLMMLVIGSRKARYLFARKIDLEHVRLGGIKAPLRDQFPIWPGSI